jgi:uncharacterized protein (DUF2235 family)
MSRNLVVCCDGTANEFAHHKTNVIKLYSTLVHDPDRQLTYYQPGIGTMEAPGAVTNIGRKVTRVLGMAVGFGLENDIRNAYVFLMKYFTPGDKLYLFGFSRGAYTVRAVASLLRMYGLIRQGQEPLIPYAIRMLTSVSGPDSAKRNERAAAAFGLAREFKSTFSSVECRPHFVGVWDTVSSVGWVENPLKLPFIANNPDIQTGRHAVAIDERRAFFRTNLWRRPDGSAESGPQDVLQVWFPGVHCDVGGGYPEAESGLSKIALEWMLREARAAGLLIDDAAEDLVLGYTGKGGYVAPNPTADAHESLKPAWWAAEFVPKRHYNFKTKKRGRKMNLFGRRTIPSGALIHESAYERGAEYASRLPADAVKVSTKPRSSASGFSAGATQSS